MLSKPYNELALLTEKLMSFREKIAWLALGGILVAFGPYFAALALFGTQPFTTARAGIGTLLGIVTLLVVAMIALSILIALTNLRDAQTPSDERDRAIARRAAARAYPVLLAGCFAGLATLFVGAGQGMLVNTLLAAITVAEVTRCGGEILGYRRAHG
jgi:hypothetical protein